MASIHFSEQQAWVKGSWVFDRFVADMQSCAQDDPELGDVLRKGDALGIICMDTLEASLRLAMVALLRKVIRKTVSDLKPSELKWQQGLDENMRDRYKKAVVALEGMIGEIDVPSV